MYTRKDMIEDPFNLAKKRNAHNTETRAYNCMGYALDTFSWLRPLNLATYKPFSFSTGIKKKDYHKVLVLASAYLIAAFGLTRISRETAYNYKGNREIVAFRIARNDFHFAVRKNNGNWFHKPGGCNIIRTTKEKIFAPTWESDCDSYDSDIIFFEKPRKNA